MVKRLLRKIGHYPVSLIVLCAIVYLSLSSHSGNDGLKLFEHADKVVHFIMYLTLSTVMWYEYYKWHTTAKYWRWIFFSFVIPALFGWLMEFMQGEFTATRSNDPLDVLSNISGVAIANIVCFFVVMPLFAKGTKKKDINFKNQNIGN